MTVVNEISLTLLMAILIRYSVYDLSILYINYQFIFLRVMTGDKLYLKQVLKKHNKAP